MKISIGTLSRAFGLSDEALRFYEKKGLLHPVRENGNGYRVFELADIQRISNIQRLKSQGFTLEEIQRVYSAAASASWRGSTGARSRRWSAGSPMTSTFWRACARLRACWKRRGIS